MRKGTNPIRNIKHKIKDYNHRIIIPVYIPDKDEYFKDTFKILRVCIASLLATISNKSAITIVNNGSCDEVVDYLNQLFKNNKIQDLIHTENIGKINSILRAVKSTSEPYITITDADILFQNKWLSKTIEVFNNHSKAGVVGVIPQFKMYEYLGYNVIADNFFNSKIKFTKVKHPEGLKSFYKSIGWDNSYNKNYLKYNLTITYNNCTALIGNGHCVATYKRTVFNKDLKYSEYILGGGSERVYLDEPCVKKGLWRLTTNGNFAYHMGNVLEPWMEEEVEKKIEEIDFKDLKLKKENKFSDQYFFYKAKLMRFIYRKMKVFFLKKWKLPKEMSSTY